MTCLAKPPWIRKTISPSSLDPVKNLLAAARLNTVCDQARCPNMGDCFSEGTATVLILGKICTRNCRFCAVEHGTPVGPDAEEPQRVARAVQKMGLRYVVITSVTRDDLDEGGASQFARTIREIYSLDRGTKTEVLIPDFKGESASLADVLRAQPTVLSHNVETVPGLYSRVRPQADYGRSLGLLRMSSQIDPKIPVKTGFMLGLGETDDEVLRLLHDLREAGCDLLTIGQYLQPRPDLLPVFRYVHPDEFEFFRIKGLEMGFKAVASGPFVRSSYRAMELVEQL
ncbi:MAG: lipoyl synthase [Syntrophobacteraceae bacterium]